MAERIPLNAAQGAMVTFYDTDFPAMTAGEARTIAMIAKIVTGHIMNAHQGVPRTKRGIEARESLVMANEFLMDLYGAMRAIETARA